MKIYPYWFEKINKLIIVYAEDILQADNIIKDTHKLNPLHSTIKTLQLTFSDLTNHKVKVVRGLDKDGKTIQSKYPSQDSFQLFCQGAVNKTINLLSTEDYDTVIKTTPKHNFTRVSISAGNIPITWGFTLEELNKKFSITYC